MAPLSEAEIRKLNLMEILMEDYEDVPEPPEEASSAWSEAEIRAYFISGGEEVPSRGGSTRVCKSKEEILKRYPPPSREEEEKWLPGLKRSGTQCKGKPALRVLCFTNAGSSEDMYTNEGVGKRFRRSPLLEYCRTHNAELLAFELPGRQKREREPFLTSVQEVAAAILKIAAYKIVDVPYVCVGHSLGSLVSFEFMSLVRDEGLPLPLHAFVSAFVAPNTPEEERPWRVNRELDNAEFQQECKDWDTNEIIFAKSIWPNVEPIMRADFTLFDTYAYKRADDPPFDFPISAYVAKHDKKIKRKFLEGWEGFTTAAFTLSEIDGHHLFPIAQLDAKCAWLQSIAEKLEAIPS